MKTLVYTLALFMLIACGSSDEPDSLVPLSISPTVARIAPAAGVAGNTITIFGSGFSLAPQLNIVSIGVTAIPCTTYNLVAAPTSTEIEQVTFVIPAGLAAGTYNLVLVVNGTPSNANLTLTIN